MRKRNTAALSALALLALLALSPSCNSGKDGELDSANQPGELAGLPIPPLPDGNVPAGAPGRVASYSQTIYAKGGSIFDASANVIFSSDSVVLPSVATGIAGVEYALYAFNTGGYKPEHVRVGIAAGTNSSAWVGFSNYDRGVWDWQGPITAPQNYDLLGTDYLDSSDRFYVIVMTFGGAVAQNDYVQITFENGVTPAFSIAGTLVDENGDPIAGETVGAFPGSSSGTTNTQGQYLIVVDSADTYTVTPGNLTYSYNPPNSMVTVDGIETGVDFTGTCIDISGHVLDGNNNGLVNVQMTLMPGGSVTKTDSTGYYRFRGVADNNYTVTPLLATYDFTPASKPANVSGADQDNIDFSGSGGQPVFSIHGRVADSISAGIQDVTLTLGPIFLFAKTDSNGEFDFFGLPNGTYTVTPAMGKATFTPSFRQVTIADANVTGTDFEFTAPPPTYTVSGKVSDPDGDGNGVPNVHVWVSKTLGGAPISQAYTEPDGTYSCFEVTAGSAYVYAEKGGYDTVNLSINVNNADLSGANLSISFSAGTPTWNNFVASYISNSCLQCHRPDAVNPVDPMLDSYDKVVNWGSLCNTRIQNNTMPPEGGGSLALYKKYFSIWRTNNYPES